jgi:hypothetical protein
MRGEDVLEASIPELVTTFRDALLAMVPLASRAGLPWEGYDAHPAWERLVAAAFDAFVSGPISTDRGRGQFDRPLARYDIDLKSYADFSWIGVGESTSELALVRLTGRAQPFDSMECVELDRETGQIGRSLVVPWAPANLQLVRRSANGDVENFSQVVAEE